MNSVCLSQLADVIKTKFILLFISAFVNSYEMPFYAIYFNIKNFS